MFVRIIRALSLVLGLCFCVSIASAQEEERWTWNVASDFSKFSQFKRSGFSNERLKLIGFKESDLLNGLADYRLAARTSALNPNGAWTYVRWAYGHIGPAELLVPKQPGQCGWNYEKALCFTGTAGADPTPAIAIYPYKEGFRPPRNYGSQLTLPSDDSVIFRIGVINGWEPGACFTAPSRGTFLFTVMAQPIDDGMQNPVEMHLYVNGDETRDDLEPKILDEFDDTRHMRVRRELKEGGTICFSISTTLDPFFSAVRVMASVRRMGEALTAR